MSWPLENLGAESDAEHTATRQSWCSINENRCLITLTISSLTNNNPSADSTMVESSIHEWRCAAPGCDRGYTERGSVFRHWRNDHSELTGGKSRDDSWAIPINQDDQNAGEGQLQPPTGVQPVASEPASVAAVAVTPVAVVAPLPLPPHQPQPPISFSPLLPPLLHRSYYFPPSSSSLPLFPPPPTRLPLAPQFLHLSSPSPSPVSRPTHQDQLRSSRSTRNQDHNVAPRNRAGGLDLDPTEGLPVQNWEFQIVRVNQDETTETAESSDQGPRFNHPGYPWSEQPLPSFFHQLPLHNQVSSPNRPTSAWRILLILVLPSAADPTGAYWQYQS